VAVLANLSVCGDLLKQATFQAFLRLYDKTDIAKKFTALFYVSGQIFKHFLIFFNFQKKVAKYGGFSDLWRWR